VRQFLYACGQSPSNLIAGLVPLYEDIRRLALGEPGDDPAPDGAKPALYLSKPELLVRTLGGGGPSEAYPGDSLDERGVLVGSPNAHRIKADFKWVHAEHYRPHIAIPTDDASAELSSDERLNRVLARADVIVNGQRLTLDPSDERVLWKAAAAFAAGFGSDAGHEALAAAVGACLSSEALRSLRHDIDAAAFDPPLAMGHSRALHEVWREADGSWRVRSTQVSHPLSQDGVSIGTDGVVLYTLTHRVELLEDGGVGVQPQDSKVVFAF
jgi:hypothetical protein